MDARAGLDQHGDRCVTAIDLSFPGHMSARAAWRCVKALNADPVFFRQFGGAVAAVLGRGENSSELSEQFGQVTKSLLAFDAYRQTFPAVLNPAKNRVKYWETLAGGSYFATGVGGGAVGRGANIFIVDDATKNRDEASSLAHRD